LYQALIQVYKRGRKSFDNKLVLEISKDKRMKRFDWRKDIEKISKDEKISNKSTFQENLEKQEKKLEKAKKKHANIKDNPDRLAFYDQKIIKLESKIKQSQQIINDVNNEAIPDEEVLVNPFNAAKLFINRNKNRLNPSVIVFQD